MSKVVLIEDEYANIFKIEKREVATEVVVKTIKRLLVAKKLVPGDKLPSETELSLMLNVSRGSVREAMKTLSAYGIVKIKRGDGTYIADTTDGILFDPLLFRLIINQGDVNELEELREMIELGIIKIAIQNATEEDIKNLESAYRYTDEKLKSKEFQDEVLIETELMFHTALGKATENKLIQTIYNFVMDLYVPNIYKDKRDELFLEEALRCHRPIIDAIKNRDLEAGEKAIKYSVGTWKHLKKEDE
ncbi:MAG: FadR/GntR family transcriptional regulator [Sedimentibacter sp.]